MCTSRHRETLRTVIISLNITNLLAFIMDKTWDGNYCSKLYKPTDPTNQEEGRINLHLRVTQHEARLRNPYCREAISITYYECVFGALLSSTQSAWAVLYFYLRPAGFCNIFPYSHKWHDFRGGKKDTEHKMCLDFLYNFCLTRFSF